MIRPTLFGLSILLFLVAATLPAADAKPDKLRVYVGTYTGKISKGIYLLELDLKTGELTDKGLVGEAANPSFVALSPDYKYLYAASEVGGGKNPGAVVAFAVDPASGKLNELNKQSSGGAGPCHLVVDKAGKNVLVANYGGGSVASLPIAPDGKLMEAASVIQHIGTGPDKGRQGEPHAHSINLDAANKFAFAADLGLDKVLVYKFDPATGKLTANDPPAGLTPPGSGPRHFAFLPNGKTAYVINEMLQTITAFAYDADKGTLKEIQTISTVPGPVKGNSTAEIVAHPSGKFVYGSNRGADTIAVFAVEADGKLKAVGHTPTGGKTPRNFNVDPTGSYLLAANQGSGTVTVFKIDEKTGELTSVGKPLAVPSPVCLRFAPVK